MKISEIIKERIPMQYLLERYGFKASRKRMPCPIHGGKNSNFQIYEKSYYCFKCGAHGGVIEFVMQYYGIDFKAAISKINDDFGLGLIQSKQQLTLTQKRKMEREIAEIQKRRQQEKAKIDSLDKAYSEALDEYIRCDKAIRSCAPASEDDVWSEEFCEALKNKTTAEYRLNVADAERNLHNG